MTLNILHVFLEWCWTLLYVQCRSRKNSAFGRLGRLASLSYLSLSPSFPLSSPSLSPSSLLSLHPLEINWCSWVPQTSLHWLSTTGETKIMKTTVGTFSTLPLLRCGHMTLMWPFLLVTPVSRDPFYWSHDSFVWSHDSNVISPFVTWLSCDRFSELKATVVLKFSQ